MNCKNNLFGIAELRKNWVYKFPFHFRLLLFICSTLFCIRNHKKYFIKRFIYFLRQTRDDTFNSKWQFMEWNVCLFLPQALENFWGKNYLGKLIYIQTMALVFHSITIWRLSQQRSVMKIHLADDVKNVLHPELIKFHLSLFLGTHENVIFLIFHSIGVYRSNLTIHLYVEHRNDDNFSSSRRI